MSTPIETNTEELQEILQTVYNLPMAGGGSSEPDLVIHFNKPDFGSLNGYAELATFNQEDVISTYNKLLSGETVNCVLNATYWPDTGGPIKASSPHITAFAKSEDGNSARVGYVDVTFNLWYNSGFLGTVLVWIRFNIHGNGTVSLVQFDVTKSTVWSSIYV